MNITNAEIKLIKALGSKKTRDEEGLFVVEGEKMVEEALKSGFKVEKIYRKEEIGETVMSRISALSSPSPALAIVRKPARTCLKTNAEIEGAVSSKGLYLGLDSIRDPGNMGTIIRMADWFGIDVVFAEPDSVDIFNPKVVQATMGAIFRINFHYADLCAVAKTFKAKNGSVYGTFLDGENMYAKHLSTGGESPVMVVTGNESRGISPALETLVTDKLYIPPYPAGSPGSESLNAAIATAITLAEFRRRYQ